MIILFYVLYSCCIVICLVKTFCFGGKKWTYSLCYNFVTFSFYAKEWMLGIDPTTKKYTWKRIFPSYPWFLQGCHWIEVTQRTQRTQAEWSRLESNHELNATVLGSSVPCLPLPRCTGHSQSSLARLMQVLIHRGFLWNHGALCFISLSLVLNFKLFSCSRFLENKQPTHGR